MFRDAFDNFPVSNDQFVSQKLDKDQEMDRIARAAAENYDSESDDDSYVELEVKDGSDDEKWDCQSILSTYSTTSNRPKLISERKVSLDTTLVEFNLIFLRTCCVISAFESFSSQKTSVLPST